MPGYQLLWSGCQVSVMCCTVLVRHPLCFMMSTGGWQLQHANRACLLRRHRDRHQVAWRGCWHGAGGALCVASFSQFQPRSYMVFARPASHPRLHTSCLCLHRS